MIPITIDETQSEQVVANGQDFYRINKIPGVDLDVQITDFQNQVDIKTREISDIQLEIAKLQNVKVLVSPNKLN